MRDSRRAWGEQPAWRILAASLLVIAAVVILATGAGHHARSSAHRPAAASRPVVLVPMATTLRIQTTSTLTAKQSRREKRSNAMRERIASQDPQDHRGTAAAKRAARELKAHRALQHVPYHHGQLTVRLTGATRSGKAVLTVTAPTLKQARAGYRRFLARYDDDGRAYAPRFLARRAHHRKHRHG